MKRISILFIAIATLMSCGSDVESKRVYKDANGRINHLMVVMKNSDWQGVLGDELRKVISEPVLGLPQPEAQFEISQVSFDNFTSLFKATRSVISIGIGEENGFKVSTNVYAAPQKIISITGKSEEDLIQEIKKNKDQIIRVFKDADLNSVQKTILKKVWDPTKIETFEKQGYSFKIPRTYNMVEDTGEFVWYRYHLNGGNSLELISYSVPITSEDDENGNNIVKIRDEMGKKYIPGQVEGSHMITEEAYTPHTFDVQLNGKKAFETRGKWEVKGVYMAGPFLSYSVVDKPNNRIVVVEGLTFAPSINKRDYMFELEAIMKTLVIQ